jgi:antitoxin (DNA-binding transcriptional repressor) of toxin-antitoxin stability system
MRTAGIREARQNLSALIEQVKNGQEITITDRGKPVATLSAPKAPKRRGLPDMSSFRNGLGVSPDAASRLAELILEERDERV